MNKIIQFLRLSRLILLVILLLIAVIAKIARADSAVLYKGSYGTPECKAFSSPDPQVVFNVCFPGAERQGWGLHKHPTREYYYVVGPNVSTEYQSIGGQLKTCDPKELSNPNPFGEGLEDRFFLSAPQGIDAADWYSDRFTSCENNCIVKNTRVLTTIRDQPGFRSDGRSILEDDGISWSWFKKRQTGEVCVVEKQKPDDPPKPPRPDTGDGADGNGQGGAGSDNGQSDGSGSSGENGSQGNSSGSQNQGSGNSNDSGSSSGGSGSGSGGVNGSGGQTGPSGGGTSGGESGGDQAEGSEGEAGGESDGSGEESGGSGDSGGEGGTDSGGQGNVGGEGNNGQNGQPGGTGEGQGNGEGDGQGSISGGSCEANQAPDCKGDPIQCYIAREQWRTACAATGQNSKVEGNGDCKAKRPPECKGDATQCYMVKSRWAEACARAELESYGQGQSSALEKALGEGGDSEGIIGDNSSTINLPGQLDTAGFGWARTCPISSQIDLGIFGKHDWLADRFCAIANFAGQFLVLLTLIASARYIL